jgi:lipopolysaccharide/colanic/teichoic acid biosynthesis glycosyltransferase
MFFSQIRIGQHGKPFTIYKIQTMVDAKVTTIGKFHPHWCSFATSTYLSIKKQIVAFATRLIKA